MATSNFHNENASKIFASEIEEDYDYEDLKSNVFTELKELAEKDKNIGFLNRGNDSTELRSYGSSVICTLFIDKTYTLPDYGQFNVRLNIVPVIRSGYYSGANLDYDYNIDIEGNECEDFEDIANALEYLGDTSREMAEYKAKFAEKWAEKTLESLRNKVENVFGQYTDKYVVAAQFSNGETIYSKID